MQDRAKDPRVECVVRSHDLPDRSAVRVQGYRWFHIAITLDKAPLRDTQTQLIRLVLFTSNQCTSPAPNDAPMR